MFFVWLGQRTEAPASQSKKLFLNHKEYLICGCEGKQRMQRSRHASIQGRVAPLMQTSAGNPFWGQFQSLEHRCPAARGL